MIAQQPTSRVTEQAYRVAIADDRNLANDAGSKEHSNSSDQIGLLHVLQQTLDAEALMYLFKHELSQVVPVDYLEFHAEEDALAFETGAKGRFTLHYRLVIGKQVLGKLTLSRTKRFRAEDIRLVENYIAVLYYPLRNALAYHRAVMSSLTDALTGLHNRGMFKQQLEREQQLADRHGDEFSLIIIDVDEFKQINDTFGHQAGDQVLTEIAGIMYKFGRKTDMLFRYAGDEFVMTLSKTDHAGAQMVANRIREAVASNTFRYAKKDVPVSISLGVATLRANESPAELFERADNALYDAKHAGRNCVVGE